MTSAVTLAHAIQTHEKLAPPWWWLQQWTAAALQYSSETVE